MITLEVTQDDINRGVPHTSDSCPLALALRRIGYKGVYVLPTMNPFQGIVELDTTVYPLSSEAWKFAQDFDSLLVVYPQSFLLNSYEELQAYNITEYRKRGQHK